MWKMEKREVEREDWEERYSRQIRLDNVGLEGQVQKDVFFIMNRKRLTKQEYWLLEQED